MTQLRFSSEINAHCNLYITEVEHLSWLSNQKLNDSSDLLKSAFENKLQYLSVQGGGKLNVFLLVKPNADSAKTKEAVRKAATSITEELNRLKIAEVKVFDKTKTSFLTEVLEGTLLSNYQFLKYHSKAAEMKNSLNTIFVDPQDISAERLDEIKCLIEGVFFARNLVNEPLSYLTAAKYSDELIEKSKESGIKIKVLGRKQITDLGMGGILAVNRGSFTPPRFNILEWKPKNASNANPIVLVGKGIVYDTGGLSLKPTANSMDFMKADMGGSAIVAGVMMAVAKNKLPLHVIALIPSTDNRPGNNAYVPGDVIKMYNGSTVEVLNTDAEGRMVLADALHYAKRYNPALVMDFATLTGAAARATAGQAISLMGTANQKLKNSLKKIGLQTHERLIEFPLWDEFGEMIKSDIADIKNIGGPGAGMITAGKFLEHFTDYPWLHFDAAGTAFSHHKRSYRGKNGTGYGVRLIYHFLKNIDLS